MDPECFVCTDSAPVPWRSDCKCTDRYVHVDCLEKMLKRGAAPRCPVCLTPYANVTYVDHRRLNACSPGIGIAALSCAFVALSGCAWSTLYAMGARSDSLSKDLVVLLAVSGFGMLIMAVCTFTVLVQIVYRIDNDAVVSECFRTNRVYHIRAPEPATLV